ncbi:MAG: hypothetical protein MK033_03090 [Candidatus Caenarcaniphilales bacterium]|nr:hypothetical protein [Candidatus Caenarcaniphilales bacterium]
MNINEQGLVRYISGISQQVLNFQEITKQSVDVALEKGFEGVQAIEDMANTFLSIKLGQRELLEKLSAVEEVFSTTIDVPIDNAFKAFLIDFSDRLNEININKTMLNTGLYEEESYRDKFIKKFELLNVLNYDQLFKIQWNVLKESLHLKSDEQEMFLDVLHSKLPDIVRNEYESLIDSEFIKSLRVLKDTKSLEGTKLQLIMSKILAELQYLKPPDETRVQ